LKNTLDCGLFYSFSNDFKLYEFYDNNYAGDINDRKNTNDFTFESCGRMCFLIEFKETIHCHLS